MAGLDLFIVNVAFNEIGRDFGGEPLANLSWVLNGYAIVFAALLVPLGRLADRFGRKGGLLIGLAVFVVASEACALAPSVWWLVGFRVLQAAGAAAVIPTSLGLLLSVFPPERRAGAVRIWSACAALAAAAGPAVGGVLVEVSWRWVFWINVPLGLLALVLSYQLLPSSREGRSARMPDLPGAAVLTISIALLALGLVKVNDWNTERSGAVLGAALFTMAVFWLLSMRHPAPVVEPSLLGVRTFAWSNATALLFSVAFAANLLVAVLWMQGVWGYSAIRTGLGIAPGPLMVPICAGLAGLLVARKVPVGVVTAIGCLLCAVGIAVMAGSIGRTPDYVHDVLPGWLIGGTGVGLALPTMLSAACADLPPDRFATGSAVVNMSRQVGAVLGVSVAVALLGSPVGFTETHRAFVNAWLVICAFMVISGLAATGMTPRRTAPVVARLQPEPWPVAARSYDPSYDPRRPAGHIEFDVLSSPGR